MNLFQKYGIKEVADVVFYSINEVGDEEFYTPVLYLDTLKVSTLEKTSEKVFAQGGYGNKRLIGWNFGKEITLNLEDALFSPASMSLIWGGKLNSKLSDYTGAIVKCNLANKYGELDYSTKAYPSPALTDEEWEIVFQQAQKINYDCNSGASNSSEYIFMENNKENVIKNRNKIVRDYFKRGIKTKKEENIIELPNVDGSDFTNYLSLFSPLRTTKTTGIKNIYSWGANGISIYLWGDKPSYTNDPQPVLLLDSIICKQSKEEMLNKLLSEGSRQGDGSYEYKGEDLLELYGYWGEIDTELSDMQKKVYKKWGTIIEEENKTPKHHRSLTVIFKYEIINNKINPKDIQFSFDDILPQEHSWQYIGTINYDVDLKSFFVNILGEENIYSKYGTTPTETIEQVAMSENILQEIINEIDSLKKIGYIDTKRDDIEVIDRMEKCIVTKKEGFTIDTQKQKENLFRYYANDESSSYTIYYDAKTMLPLLHVEDDLIIGWNDSSEENTTFKLKLGTVYYKWTRTVKRKESEDDGILGRTLVIDAETFPDSYRIVGETYIREQKTGKDQRYQFTIFKANVSADTSVTLQAEGDPTTFSMAIDVLTPPNDIMMELKEYDVEEDLFEGGTRIVPQKSKYSYTPAMVEELTTEVEDNNELY